MARQSTGHPFFDYLVGHVTEEMDVLDVGCASGVLTMEVSRFAKTAVGIDLSPAAVDFANQLKEIEYQRFKLIEETLQKSFQSDKIKSVRFITADASELPFDDASYDLAFSTEVFEHIPEPRRAFEEIIRVLKPGGQAFLNIPRPQIDINLDIKTWERDFIQMADKDAVSRIHPDELVAWCNDKDVNIVNLTHSDAHVFVHLGKKKSMRNTQSAIRNPQSANGSPESLSSAGSATSGHLSRLTP